MAAEPACGHRRIDLRSIAMHQAIAVKLRRDPGLLQIAHDNLNRWMAEGGRSLPYLEAWRALLARPLEELCTMIGEDSERMAALRQNSPFAGILTPEERWRIYDAFAVGTYHPRGGDDRR
jgi:hypothetical protein